MKLIPRLAVTAALVAALAAPALAQQGTPPTPEQRAARFDAADANKDGKLTKAEFVASLPEQAKDRADMIWARMNPTGKDSISKDEYLAAPMGRGGAGGATPPKP